VAVGRRLFERLAAAQARLEQLRDQLLAGAVDPLPSWARSHAEKARTGRLLSLVALKCGDCSGWQKAEVAGCAV
jgi:hypothetical protein